MKIVVFDTQKYLKQELKGTGFAPFISLTSSEIRESQHTYTPAKCGNKGRRTLTQTEKEKEEEEDETLWRSRSLAENGWREGGSVVRGDSSVWWIITD